MKAISIILGVLMSIVGICAFAMPFRTFLGIGWVVGILFMCYGIEAAVEGFKKAKKDVFGIIIGILAVIVGIAITTSFAQRALTDLFIAYLIGFNLIIFGVFRIISAVGLYKSGQKSAAVLMIICNVLAVICGIVAVGHPFMTMISVGYIIAINLLVQGVIIIVTACSIKTDK